MLVGEMPYLILEEVSLRFPPCNYVIVLKNKYQVRNRLNSAFYKAPLISEKVIKMFCQS